MKRLLLLLPFYLLLTGSSSQWEGFWASPEQPSWFSLKAGAEDANHFCVSYGRNLLKGVVIRDSDHELHLQVPVLRGSVSTATTLIFTQEESGTLLPISIWVLCETAMRGSLSMPRRRPVRLGFISKWIPGQSKRRTMTGARHSTPCCRHQQTSRGCVPSENRTWPVDMPSDCMETFGIHLHFPLCFRGNPV